MTDRKAKQGDSVKVHYTGKLEDGTVFDSSVNREPLQFTIGKGQVITGFEQAVVGMNPGESKTTKVLSNQAYGPYRKEMVLEVDRKEFPEHLKPEIGQEYQIPREGARPTLVTVTEVSESKVVLDANHPLAGRDLIFDVQLLEII